MPETRWGLTLPFAGVPLAEHPAYVRLADEAGYDDLWTGETAGPDGFTPLIVASQHTRRLRLATGIVNPFTRGRALLAQQTAAMADVTGGRFVLGLGASSNVIVERWNGVPFEKPLSKIRATVEYLRPVLAGERGAGGFRLESPPAEPVPIVLA
ncbi:MAG: LLM class flavin-dependent oxidoreductase, partial [Solirubrobacteraceae bacterium]|nr:LLM class flavin-dependent oxidoreductase [Solirubrobacteraceae bacterium]